MTPIEKFNLVMQQVIKYADIVISNDNNENNNIDNANNNGGVTNWNAPIEVSELANVMTGSVFVDTAAYGNNKFVGISNFSQYVVVGTSTDGVTGWNGSTPSELQGYRWVSMVYGNNKFVVAGYDLTGDLPTICISTSTDGTTWTTPAVVYPMFLQNDQQTPIALTYTGQQFVILGALANMETKTADWAISTSTDGTTWTTPSVTNLSFTPNITIIWYNLVYGNGKFVIFGGKSSEDIVYTSTSTDGITWSEPIQIENLSIHRPITIYAGGIFIRLCLTPLNEGEYSDYGIITSSDGENWSEFTPVNNLGSLYGDTSNFDWSCIAYNGTKIHLYGYDYVEEHPVLTTCEIAATPDEDEDDSMSTMEKYNIVLQALLDIISASTAPSTITFNYPYCAFWVFDKAKCDTITQERDLADDDWDDIFLFNLSQATDFNVTDGVFTCTYNNKTYSLTRDSETHEPVCTYDGNEVYTEDCIYNITLGITNNGANDLADRFFTSDSPL